MEEAGVPVGEVAVLGSQPWPIGALCSAFIRALLLFSLRLHADRTTLWQVVSVWGPQMDNSAAHRPLCLAAEQLKIQQAVHAVDGTTAAAFFTKGVMPVGFICRGLVPACQRHCTF